VHVETTKRRLSTLRGVVASADVTNDHSQNKKQRCILFP
jgi:hypothetical protein